MEIQVCDTGIGIKEEDMSKLFKLFGFLEANKEINTQGIGLGLHITRKILQELNGEIVCRSTLGHGTTFTFIICLDSKTNNEGHEQLNRIFNPI